jgi:hypothetical protein
MRRARRAESTKPKQKRKMRSRPVPRWLKKTSNELDEIAQRRCLMILSVLSGEQPVTTAIEEAKLTRPYYYLLERRAIEAMIRALMPGSESSESAAVTSAGRIRELEEQVRKLEQEKRRGERLLFLTKRVLGSGPLTQKRRGRPPKVSSDPSSTMNGRRASRRSKTKERASSTAANSIPTKDGGSEPTPGSAS